MSFEIEVVKFGEGSVLYDEICKMGQCPECGGDMADTWRYCPSCGAGPVEAVEPIGTCENASPTEELFLCSACGRTYVPVQIINREEPGRVDWACCPGCRAVIC